MSIIRSTVTTIRSSTARQRAARTDRRRLERELATYRTSAERHDLDAILSRHSAEEIAPIERILSQQSRPGGLAYRSSLG